MTQQFEYILPKIIDSTMMVARRSCDHKYWLEFCLGLRGGGKSQDLVAGKAFATATELVRRRQFADPERKLNDIQKEVFPLYLKEWGDFQITDERNPKTKDRVWVALEQSFLKHPPLSDEAQPFINAAGDPAIEFTFAIPLDDFPHHPSGEPFILCGRFDMLARYHGKLAVLDEKTTKALGPKWSEQWDLRNQFMTYCWACQQLGYDVDMAVVRGVGILKTEIKLATAVPRFQPHMLERFERILYNDLEQIVKNHHSGIWEYNFAESCTNYGGCQYRSVCRSVNPERWMSEYEVNRWNPLEATQNKDAIDV